VSQLAAASTAPRVEAPICRESDGMRVSASYLDHSYVEEELDNSWSRLIRIALDIGGQVFHAG